VREALTAGARTIQLRDKNASAREMAEQAGALLELTRPAGALLIVNDRADVALAVGADGVHLGPDDLPVEAVRRQAPEDFVIGYSTDDPPEARRAEMDGATYLGCGAVWSTGTKDVGGEAIGLARLRAVVEAVRIPVVAIGGVTPARARELRGTGAVGAAVVSAVMGAGDPGAVVGELLSSWIIRPTRYC
jgi:thiamine-phosphate pyrophosphorylase